MDKRKNISDELLSISPGVAAIPVVNVFSVPEGYFKGLVPNILSAISQEENILPAVPQQLFSVPEGYFDNLAASILSKIKNEKEENAIIEIASISPTIADIGNKNIFTVPTGYFENLTEEIVNNIPQPAKVIEMKKRPAFFKIAAAAAVTGIIGLSVISVLNKKPDPGETNKMIASVNQIIKTNSFDKELNSLSDKDIEQYLKQQGQDVNAALVAASTDDNILPEPEDYIIDDNTLNNYLSKANLNN